jgi:mono/diheme cytochrome c family protein
MKRNAKILVGAVVLVAAGVVFGLKVYRDKLTVSLPDYSPIGKAVWLDQNWDPKKRDWYHHADQGTLTFNIPYEWFIALEQPALSLTAVGLLSDANYLDRYGFIPSSAENSKHELPIGFARGAPMKKADGTPWQNPQTKKVMTGVGLNCAACHTGRFTYQNTTVLIDGGPALTDLGKLRQGLGISVLFTRIVPYRFDRFAERVLGADASKEAKAELRMDLENVWKQFDIVKGLDAKVADQSLEEGFGRLDALNRIGNTVFALDLEKFDNYVGTSAPVHYPRIWNASWFDWVQYNGSIEQPMVRNAGEALGVSAKINLTDTTRLYESNLEVNTLFEVEEMIAGKQPNASRGFNGLQSPKWPSDILPAIDSKLAAKGAALYKEICQECHLPPVASQEFWDSKNWLPANAAGERYLHVELIDIEHIGTDPAQAEDMLKRKVSVPEGLGITSNDFGFALGQVVEKTVNRWYDSQTPPIADALRQEMNGYRENGIQAPLKYKVRPLNGIWATPPYLHNGSVPNIYLLLSPVAERPNTFYLGHRDYDPVNVGYRYDELSGGFKFDTAIRGNQNTGHEFNDDRKKSGVIGRGLSPDERRALVEYLKQL